MASILRTCRVYNDSVPAKFDRGMFLAPQQSAFCSQLESIHCIIVAALSKPELEDILISKADYDRIPVMAPAQPTSPCSASMSTRDSIWLFTACPGLIVVKFVIGDHNSAGLFLECSIA